jgi:hypothetical protein
VLEKLFRARGVEVWIAEFFEGGKGTKECKALILEGNWCIGRGYGVEVGYVKAERSSITEDTD